MLIDYSYIGARIKRVRKQKHITQEQLAEKLSVTVGYVSQIERGTSKANLEMLASISSILGCNLCFLIDGTIIGAPHYLRSEWSELLDRMSPDQQKLLASIAEDIISSGLSRPGEV
ncbi:MAG: helix-turn-helix domain-containing protein [Clostridia bacterium]|nr:helix-turn-helix domain-containing protein [Clostridia bacterium]